MTVLRPPALGPPSSVRRSALLRVAQLSGLIAAGVLVAVAMMRVA